MKVEVADVSQVEKRVEIEVPAERVDDEIGEQYEELKNTAQVKGFRPGKTPRKLLERLFKDYVREMVVKKLVEETLETALSRKGIEPVVEPVIDPAELEAGKPYSYTVHVEVKPVVEPKDYKGVEVEHAEQKVTDDDVDKSLAQFQESVAIIREPEEERPVKGDDMLSAEVSIKVDGEEADGTGAGEQDVELWKPSWIPGLADQLSGHVVGDEVTFTESGADDEGTPEQFRGKTLDFSFKISAVKERVLAELDDDFAKENTKFETMDELKESVRETLEQQAEEGNVSRLQSLVLDKILESNPVEVPPGLVGRQAVMMAKDFMQRNVGKEPSDEEAERFSGMFTEEAKKTFMAHYLVEAIAEIEGIEADDDEVEARVKEEADKYQVHPDKFKDRLGEQGLEGVRESVIMGKTLDFLVAAATIKEGESVTEDQSDD